MAKLSLLQAMLATKGGILLSRMAARAIERALEELPALMRKARGRRRRKGIKIFHLSGRIMIPVSMTIEAKDKEEVRESIEGTVRQLKKFNVVSGEVQTRIGIVERPEIVE